MPSEPADDSTAAERGAARPPDREADLVAGRGTRPGREEEDGEPRGARERRRCQDDDALARHQDTEAEQSLRSGRDQHDQRHDGSVCLRVVQQVEDDVEHALDARNAEQVRAVSEVVGRY